MRTPAHVFVLVCLIGACAAPAAVQPGPSQPASAPAAVEPDPVARVLREAARDEQVVALLRELCADHAPRLTGSRAADEACEWTRAKFESWGLEARLETWGMAPARFDRGPSHGRILGAQPVDLDFLTPSWTVGTQGVVGGRAVLEPKDEAELAVRTASYGAQPFRGAWIVKTGERLDGKWSRSLEALYDEQGAAGVLRAGAKSGLLLMAGDMEARNRGKRPAVRVRHDQHEAMVARLRAGEALELEFRIDNRFEDGPAPCSNVVADIKGVEFPDEYVLVQGHLDTWDGAQGAQDNGTGVATTMEAARLVMQSGIRPRRTIRFVLYTGEEQGLFGSQGYVRDHADELERISVVLNHDGGGTHLAGLDSTWAMRADMDALAARLAGLDPARPFSIREVDGLRNSGDSDHAPFVGAGVPAFFWQQSEEGYERVHHTQHDTFENTPLDDVRHSAKVVAAAAVHFAMLDHRLDRTDMKAPPRRTMGVRLGDACELERVEADSRAGKAGLKQGDKLLSVDGIPVAERGEVSDLVQRLGARQVFAVQRGDQRVEAVLDWSDDPDEPARAERTERRARRGAGP